MIATIIEIIVSKQIIHSVKFFTLTKKSGGTSNNLCEIGYTGPKCSVCDKGYSKIVSNLCISCQNSVISLIINILLFIFIMMMLILYAG